MSMVPSTTRQQTDSSNDNANDQSKSKSKSGQSNPKSQSPPPLLFRHAANPSAVPTTTPSRSRDVLPTVHEVGCQQAPCAHHLKGGEHPDGVRHVNKAIPNSDRRPHAPRDGSFLPTQGPLCGRKAGSRPSMVLPWWLNTVLES